MRADLPDKRDPDFDVYHGRIGEIIEVLYDDASTETGDKRDSLLYRVEFDNGAIAEFRWRDLRSP